MTPDPRSGDPLYVDEETSVTEEPRRTWRHRVAGLVCRYRGHSNAMWSLPEDEFGLYAYSRLYCSRCEATQRWRDGFEPGGRFR